MRSLTILVVLTALLPAFAAEEGAWTLSPTASVREYRGPRVYDARLGTFTNATELVSPLWPLASMLGATVAEDPDGQITATRDGVTFRCRVGDAAARVGDKPVQLPLSPYEECGVVYIPLKPLIAAWGGTVTDKPGMIHTVAVALPNLPPVTLDYVMRATPLPDDLYLMRPDGGDVRRITYDGGPKSQLSLSPDGAHLAYVRDGALFLCRMAAPEVRRLMVPGGMDDIQVMPDGKAFLYKARTGGSRFGNITRVTLGDEEQAVSYLGHYGDGKADMRVLGQGDNPRVSPDGQVVVYTGSDADSKADVLMCMDADGGNARCLRVGSSTPVAFSPDGTKLLYIQPTRDPDKNSPDARAVVEVLRGPGAGTRYETPPECRALYFMSYGDFSPDGRQVVFPLMTGELCLANAEMTDPRPLAKSLGGLRNRTPIRFTPDGQTILCIAWDSALCRVGVDGEAKRISPTGYEVSDYCVTPDGRVLAAMRPQPCQLPTAPPDVLRVNGILMAPIEKLFYTGNNFSLTKSRFSVSLSGVTIQGAVGETTATIPGTMSRGPNGQVVRESKTITLPTATALAHGEVYCPLEPLMEAAGWSLAVDEARGVVTIASPPDSNRQVHVELPLVDVPSLEAAWRAENRTEVYATYPTGAPTTRLTFDTEAGALPIFTADGNYLLTVHGKTGCFPLRYRGVQAMTFDMPPGTQALPNATSPVSPRDPRITVTARDGGIWLERPTGDPLLLVKGDALSEPSFTPDGDRIVYLRDGKLYAMRPDGGGKTCLSAELRVTAYTVAPNGMVFFLGVAPEPQAPDDPAAPLRKAVQEAQALPVNDKRVLTSYLALLTYYRQANKTAQAEDLGAQFLAQVEKAFGEKDPRVAQFFLTHAQTYQKPRMETSDRDGPRGVFLYRLALAAREKEVGPDDPALVEILLALHDLRNYTGGNRQGTPPAAAEENQTLQRNYADAKQDKFPYLLRAAAIMNADTSDDPQRIPLLSRLVTATRAELPQACAALSRRLLDLQAIHLWPDDPRISANWQTTQATQVPLPERIIEQQCLLAWAEQTDLIGESSTLGISHAFLVRTYQQLGYYDEARAAMERQAEYYRRKDPTAVPSNAQRMGDLAQAQGRYAAAEEHYRQAVVLAEQEVAKEKESYRQKARYQTLGEALLDLSESLRAQSKEDEMRHARDRAKAAFQAGINTRRYTVVTGERVGDSSIDYAVILEREIQNTEKRQGRLHDNTADAYRDLGRYCMNSKQPAKAEVPLQRVVDIWEVMLGPNHRVLTYPLTELAACKAALGKAEEAETLFRRAVAIAETAYGTDAPILGAMRAMYEKGKG